MYCNKRNTLQLTALMLKAGITDVVICPGSRNSPLANNFSVAGMNCIPVTDERCAGFVAIGLGQALRRAVAVCVTSGSAVLNLAPAVAEAFYQKLPLLVITADRPERWLDQMDGQTLPQPGAFGRMVHKCVQLPEPNWGDSPENNEIAWACNRLINEAFIEMNRKNGPVQVNVPITEPFFDFSVENLPDERLISYSETAFSSVKVDFSVGKSTKAMVIIGQLSAKEADGCRSALKSLVEKHKNIVVCAEYLSNIGYDCPNVLRNFDEVLSAHSADDTLMPDVVFVLGGHVVSKRLKNFIRNASPERLVQFVSDDYSLPDTYKCVTHFVKTSAEDAFKIIEQQLIDTDKTFFGRWKNLSDNLKEKADKYSFSSFCDLSALKFISENIDRKFAIHVANSSMVRNIQMFDASYSEVFCNRGVNGIEGCVSAAQGFRLGGRDTLLLVGDLAFFYDSNALWIEDSMNTQKSRNKLRIVVFNNHLGQIFRNLKGLDKASSYQEYIAGKHSAGAEHIAKAFNARYFNAESLSELKSVFRKFMDDVDSHTSILELFIDSEASKNEFSKYFEHITKQ